MKSFGAQRFSLSHNETCQNLKWAIFYHKWWRLAAAVGFFTYIINVVNSWIACSSGERWVAALLDWFSFPMWTSIDIGCLPTKSKSLHLKFALLYECPFRWHFKSVIFSIFLSQNYILISEFFLGLIYKITIWTLKAIKFLLSWWSLDI